MKRFLGWIGVALVVVLATGLTNCGGSGTSGGGESRWRAW